MSLSQPRQCINMRAPTLITRRRAPHPGDQVKALAAVNPPSRTHAGEGKDAASRRREGGAESSGSLFKVDENEKVGEEGEVLCVAGGEEGEAGEGRGW